MWAKLKIEIHLKLNQDIILTFKTETRKLLRSTDDKITKGKSGEKYLI